MQLPAPTGVYARYQGNGSLGTTEFWYWVQALYVEGYSLLSSLCPTGAVCPASFDQNNFVAVQWNPAPGAIGYLVWRTTTSAPPTTGDELLFIATSETGIKDDGSLILMIGTVRFDSAYTFKAIYNFAVDGGVVGAITPAISDTIPAGALIFGGAVVATTSVTSGGSTTISIGTTAGSGAASILAATAKASFAAGDSIALTATTAPFLMSAAGQIDITVAVANLTAGVFEVFVIAVFPTT